MRKLLCFVILGFWAVSGQENALQKLPKSLRECYNNTYMLDRQNKLPQNLQSFLGILRKIEDSSEVVDNHWSLQRLSVELLHRFRQDGLVSDPSIPSQPGVTPWAPNGPQFQRFSQMLKLIPGDAKYFPNNSISSVERCSLHSMLSVSIDLTERGDESTTCGGTNAAYRRLKNLRKRSVKRSNSREDDVETLSADQLEIMGKDNSNDRGVDPNSWYPPLPPNHPDSQRLRAPTLSRCPVENGVVKTKWGPVAIGSVVAGIAAGLEHQQTSLSNLFRGRALSSLSQSESKVDNKWIATIAGNLAEVALQQGPLPEETRVGVAGHWNSTYLPRWHFLSSNEALSYTAAEVRGDLDGLILANEVKELSNRYPDLRLSQIIDMYYSDRGVFDKSFRACNRKYMRSSVAPNDTTVTQAFRTALVIDVAQVTIDPDIIEKFAAKAAEKYFLFTPSMNDPDCTHFSNETTFNRISTDITIVVDTNWPFASIQSILAALLDDLDINKYNSNFTVISGHDGKTMINNTDSILDFYMFNETEYSKYKGDFKLSESFDTVKSILSTNLEEERSRRAGGTNSQVVLMIPHVTSVSSADKDYVKNQLKIFYEDIPDAIFFYLATGSKDSWTDLVRDQNYDIFLINGAPSSTEIATQVDSMISRIRDVPKRLINSKCGSNYVASSSDADSFEDYLEPMGMNIYRLHPNYYYRVDAEAYSTIEIQGSQSASLSVCVSRDPIRMDSKPSDCRVVSSNSESITFGCGDASFIHDCAPLYLSVKVTSGTNSAVQCTNRKFCRYPDMVKYKISYKNLLCTNSANLAIISPIILAVLTMCSYFY